MKQELSDEELITRLRSGVDPHEYRHEWGCSVLEMAARRIAAFLCQERIMVLLHSNEKKKLNDLGVETGNERLL